MNVVVVLVVNVLCNYEYLFVFCKIDNPVLLFLMIVFAYMIAKKQGWGNDCRELNWNNTKNKLVMKLLISVLG